MRRAANRLHYTRAMSSPGAGLRQALLACIAAFPCLSAWPGEFIVNPIRLELSASARSGVISVRNEGKDKLAFQMQAMEWSQDPQGKDVYAETPELIFFPKLMTVDPGKEGIIRIGARVASVPREKTFRLFIEELPGPVAAASGPQLNVLIRFGAPVFIKPVKADDQLEIESVELAAGELSMVVHNTGNQHQVVEGIQLKGTDGQGRETYALTLSDRYLLAGARKRYTTTIPKDKCGQLVQLAIDVKTDKLTRSRKLDIGKAMCP